MLIHIFRQKRSYLSQESGLSFHLNKLYLLNISIQQQLLPNAKYVYAIYELHIVRFKFICSLLQNISMQFMQCILLRFKFICRMLDNELGRIPGKKKDDSLQSQKACLHTLPNTLSINYCGYNLNTENLIVMLQKQKKHFKCGSYIIHI
jgi:hypothetical protein